MRKAQHVVVAYRFNDYNGKYTVKLVSVFDCNGNSHMLYHKSDESDYPYYYDNMHDVIDDIIKLCKNNNFYINTVSHDFNAKWYPIDFMNLDDEYPAFNRYGYTPY